MVGTVDLNGTDLLGGTSGDALYLVGVDGLAYCTATSYPHSFFYKLCVEKRSSVYSVHHQTKLHDRLTAGLGVGPITMNFTVTSTSLLNIRMSSVDPTNAFTGLAYVYPLLWHI